VLLVGLLLSTVVAAAGGGDDPVVPTPIRPTASQRG